MIIVCPEQEFAEFADIPLEMSCTIIPESMSGIYSAMNDGVKAASRDYVMFFGSDDVLLSSPNIADEDLVYDVILFDVFWGQKGVYKNFRNKYSLLFRNWCHQGVVYKRDVFYNTGFYELLYKYQEDHHMNMKIAANGSLKVHKSASIISWYSADGVSSVEQDKIFRANFPILVSQNYGYLVGFIIKMKRYIYG